MDSQQTHDPFHSIYHLRSRGVFFLSTVHEGRAHFHFGCWVTQCSHQPPRMLACFPKEYEGAELVQQGGVFALSMVAADQEEFHDRFFSGAQTMDALGQEHFKVAQTGCPYLKDAVAYFDCRVTQIVDNGDFLIIIGDILQAEALHPEKKTLNVEYLARERQRDYSTGPLVYPFRGFDLV